LAKKREVKVIWLGRLDENSKIMEIKRSKFMLLPSSHEGFGMTPLEALTAKVPCICSNLEVFREVYKNHVLYFNNFDELKQIIIDFDTCKIDLEKGYKHAQNFSWEHSADAFEAMIK
jgi:glycosyltransferase involved in cell wall biosynthesis